MAIPGLTRFFELVVRPFRGRAAVDQEIALHFELTVDELMRKGMSAEAARAEAHRRFGSLTHYREAMVAIDHRLRRRQALRNRLGDWAADFRYLLRGLRQSPVFTLGVALTLTVGIGMNATMIGLVDRLLFKPPAGVVDPDRLARYTITKTLDFFGRLTNTTASWKEVEVQTRSKSLAGTAAYYRSRASLGRGENARTVPLQIVTPNYFPLLGVHPALGRFFTEAEDPVGGGAPVVVISHRMWTRDYARSPAVLGKSLWIGNQYATVIGVTPESFNGIDLDATDLWLPFQSGMRLVLSADLVKLWDTWNWQWIGVVARLKPGVTRSEASAEATTLYRAAVADRPHDRDDQGTVTFQPIIAARGADEGKAPVVAALLAGVSVLLLLITCANVANLFLARGLARRQEIAVRLALGIGRGRLVRLLLGEGFLLAGIGAVGGLLLAYGGGLVVRRVFFPNIEFVDSPVDGRLLLVTLIVSFATAVLIGLAPALRITKPDLATELKSGSGSAQASSSRSHHRLRAGLLLVQGTLSVMMLIGAALFVKSFRQAAAVDFGFQPSGLLVARISLEEAGYSKDQVVQFFQEAYQRFQSLPGVSHVALATANPFSTRYSTGFRIPGRDSVPRLPSGGPYYAAITPDYLATFGIELKRGRNFQDTDRFGAPPVLLINETMARTLWPGEDALGKCAYVGRSTNECWEVVGIVADAASESLDLELVQAYYIPLDQATGFTKDRTLFIRTAGAPAEMIPTVRRILQTMAPNLPVANVHLFQDQMEDLYRPWRLGSTLFGVMGGVALVVVLIGLYSTLSYAVVQRRREFGIRSALGASARDVVGLVLAEGQRIIAVGLVLGIGVALGAGRWLRPLLFRTSPYDPLILGLVALVLVAATVLASVIPARRASRVQPMMTLRAD